MKNCTKCGEAKPLSDFGKMTAAKDGLKYFCRPCEVARVTAWKRTNPGALKAWAAKNAEAFEATQAAGGSRRCRKCREDKPISAFGRDPNKADGVRLRCLSCNCAAVMANYEAEPEKHRAKTAAWREKNPEQAAALIRNYRLLHRSRLNAYRANYRIAHLDYEKERDRLWSRNNPGITCAKNGRRRALKLNATPVWLSAIQKAQIQEVYDVALALSIQTGIKHHVDHVVPLKHPDVAGLHVPWNLRAIPASENCKKNNRLLAELSEKGVSSHGR